VLLSLLNKSVYIKMNINVKFAKLEDSVYAQILIEGRIPMHYSKPIFHIMNSRENSHGNCANGSAANTGDAACNTGTGVNSSGVYCGTGAGDGNGCLSGTAAKDIAVPHCGSGSGPNSTCGVGSVAQ
jgi:hypothetical protein